MALERLEGGPRGVNVLALIKGEERYVFLYDDTRGSIEQLLRQLGEYAADPDLNFSWIDSDVLQQKAVDLQENVCRPAYYSLRDPTHVYKS